MLETFAKLEQEEEYRLLVRSLLWPKGFGLFFVECLPAQAERLIQRLQQDILNKKIEVLRFDRPIENLYDKVDELLQENGTKIDILCLKGLDKSLREYIKPGYGGQGNYYKEDTIPPLLGHLNWQRERFRDDFNICFVFFLPKFAIKYFLRRAPDFYDWRSGSFEFSPDPEIIEKSIREIEKKLQSQEIANLTNSVWLSRSWSLFKSQRFEEAVASLDKAIAIEPNNVEIWRLRGVSLWILGSLEEALANFDKALEIQPLVYTHWIDRGYILSSLEQYSEAIASFEKAIALEPNNSLAWNNRGNALAKLQEYQEAIASFVDTSTA